MFPPLFVISRVKLVDPSKEYKYTMKFCEDIEGTKGDLAYAGVMQYGNWNNNTDHKHAIGRINATDIKVGSKYF